MYITSLKLKNFRNYREGFFKFKPGINFILGPNTKGKTNLLEAIYFFVFFHSFRVKEFKSLIKEKQTNSIFELGFKNRNNNGEDEKKTFQSILNLNQTKDKEVVNKAFKLNGVVKSSNKLIGEFQAVLFTPEDLDLVLATKSVRRKFLNNLISKLSLDYYKDLIEYKKVVQTRSRLLFFVNKGTAQPDELSFWNKEFLRLAEKIILKRLDILKKINIEVKKIYPEISQKKDFFQLEYDFNFDYQDKTSSDLKQALRDYLTKIFDRELRFGQTLFGPHRDDFIFKLNHRPLVSFGSRGEQRSAVLALKLAELRVIKAKIKQTPVLLLDDVLSELDCNRQTAFLDFIKKQQVIITATDIGLLKNWKEFKQINLIEL